MKKKAFKNFFNFLYKKIKDLQKCVEWLQEENEKKPKTIEEKLIEQLIIDSFEKTATLENRILKIKPEDYIFSKIEYYWNNKLKVYGNFTTVCQSSGFGKSRACQNLSKKTYVVYCCLRPQKSYTGYPKRSYLADKLTQVYDDEYLTRQHFIKYFNMFVHFLNLNKSFSYQEFYKKFSNGYDGHSPYVQHKSLKYEINKLELDCPNTDKLIDYQNNEPLIFVFDEASSLLQPNPDIKQKYQKLKPNYFIMRSLLSELNPDKKVFVLFLDTFSSLSSFMPNKWHDPSKRASESLLIEPIYLLPNWDVYTNTESIQMMHWPFLAVDLAH